MLIKLMMSMVKKKLLPPLGLSPVFSLFVSFVVSFSVFYHLF